MLMLTAHLRRKGKEKVLFKICRKEKTENLEAKHEIIEVHEGGINRH